jgi:hypothetical protein
MTDDTPTVESMSIACVPEQPPPRIVRSRQLIEAVRAQSLLETGSHGGAALAWHWALTGTRPSPVTFSPPAGVPPSRAEILAEASAPPEGSTAPPGVPADFCDQLAEARHILAWLTGDTDEIPVDDDNRGRFIGARDDYARTDADICQIRDLARRSLDAFDLPDPIDPDDAQHPWRWPATWMNAAWQRGVRDLLDWVLGDSPTAPLSSKAITLPTLYDLSYEEAAAEEVVLQGRPGGTPIDPARQPPPQYGEGIQAAIIWLRGQTTRPPIDRHGLSPYAISRGG